jgi:hypothetical protein
MHTQRKQAPVCGTEMEDGEVAISNYPVFIRENKKRNDFAIL